MAGKKEIQEQIICAVEKVKETNPLAGSITNTVTINFVANAQLAVGGSAAMVYLPDEGEGIAQASKAVYINVGTLLPVYGETVPRTAKFLHESGKPWVLDPVAVGMGNLRTKLLKQIKEYKPSIIRGNASEIITLAGLWELTGSAGQQRVRGVDTTDSVESAGVWQNRLHNRRVSLCAFLRRLAIPADDNRLRLFSRRRRRGLCVCLITVHRSAHCHRRLQPRGITR